MTPTIEQLITNKTKKDMNTEICLSMMGLENLQTALSLCGKIHSKVEAYKVENNSIIFYWGDTGKDVIKLPYPMDMRQLATFAWGWLDVTKPDGKRPEGEGDTDKGWSLYARDFSVVEGETYSFITLAPVWFYFGK